MLSTEATTNLTMLQNDLKNGGSSHMSREVRFVECTVISLRVSV